MPLRPSSLARLPRRCALALALSLAAAACGDDDSGTDAGADLGPAPPPPPPTDSGPPTHDSATAPPLDSGPSAGDSGSPADALEAFCMRGAMTECSGNQRCCTTPYPSLDECLRAQSAACRSDLGALFASSPGLRVDPARLDAFFAFVQGAAERCAGPAPDLGLLPLAGPVPEGGDCTSSGAPDDLALFRCAEGLRCAIDVTERRGTCRPAPGPGEPCSTPYACPADHFCSGSFDVMPAVAGTCQPRLADGTTCARDDQCAGGRCSTASSCEPRAQSFCFGP